MHSSEEAELEQLFTDTDPGDRGDSFTVLRSLAKSELRPYRGVAFWVNGGLCIALLTLLVIVLGKARSAQFCPNQLLYSPAQGVLEYEIRVFQLGFGNGRTKYQGQPSPELDKNWNDLYEMGIPSLIPRDMAAKLPNKTVIFPHDKQRRYMIALDVFHQLHCLNMIRMALHPEYYGGSDGHARLHDRGMGTVDEDLFDVDHMDHCIDSIRQSLTCNADISAITWSWDRKENRNVAQATVPHVCRRFDKIQEWARTHAVHRAWDAEFRETNDPLNPDTWTDSHVR